MTQWTFTEEAIRAATMIVEVRAMAVAVTKFHTEIRFNGCCGEKGTRTSN
jgi:hypothetical protein